MKLKNNPWNSWDWDKYPWDSLGTQSFGTSLWDKNPLDWQSRLIPTPGPKRYFKYLLIQLRYVRAFLNELWFLSIPKVLENTPSFISLKFYLASFHRKYLSKLTLDWKLIDIWITLVRHITLISVRSISHSKIIQKMLTVWCSYIKMH